MSAWEEWDHPGKGHGKGRDHPVVPEPSFYGSFFLFVLLAAVLVRRYCRK